MQTEHLTKIYSRQRIAVNDLNLDFPKGSVFGLLGPSGAGKATTLRVMLGLQRALARRAQVFGKSCGANAVGVRRTIGPANKPATAGSSEALSYIWILLASLIACRASCANRGWHPCCALSACSVVSMGFLLGELRGSHAGCSCLGDEEFLFAPFVMHFVRTETPCNSHRVVVCRMSEVLRGEIL